MQRVLVIDDDPRILEIVQQTLRAQGIEVTVARTTRAAAVEVGIATFDAILLDPDSLQDGDIEFHRRLRTLQRNVPVLILSTRVPVESEAALAAVGGTRRPREADAIVEEVQRAAEMIAGAAAEPSF